MPAMQGHGDSNTRARVELPQGREYARPVAGSRVIEDSTDISALSDEDFKAKFGDLLPLAQNERRDNQLLWYRPVSATALAIHESAARVVGIGGGEPAARQTPWARG